MSVRCAVPYIAYEETSSSSLKFFLILWNCSEHLSVEAFFHSSCPSISLLQTHWFYELVKIHSMLQRNNKPEHIKPSFQKTSTSRVTETDNQMTIHFSILTCKGFNVNCDPSLTFPLYILLLKWGLNQKRPFPSFWLLGTVLR